jgi:type IV pilus assembly protein PilC
MPNYAYTARDTMGQSVTGTLPAEDTADAIRQIRASGKFPVSVVVAKDEQVQQPGALRGGGIRISRPDLIQLSTQLSIMLDTGVTLSEALDCIAKQTIRPNVKGLVMDLAQQIQQGASFSEALVRHPRSFPTLYIALIKAAEKGGMMPRLINRATSYLRDEQDTKRRVTGALIYPLIMFSFALLTTLFLLVFVLPRFTVIYANKKAALPLPTQILMDASQFLLDHWLAIPLCAIGSVVGLVTFIRTPAGARMWHSFQLRVPLFGKMYKKMHLSRGLRMLGTLSGAGVPLMDCVVTARDLCENHHFRTLWQSISDQIQCGKQLSSPLFDSPLVPRDVAQMIFSGEKSGKLAVVVEQVSGYAEQELKDQIMALTRYIEPIMIVAMGAIIGGVSLALLLPVFSISKVMAH